MVLMTINDNVGTKNLISEKTSKLDEDELIKDEFFSEIATQII
jgi:hypothetical protein